MRVQVSGKHVAVGEALRTRIGDDLTGAIGKYFERGGDADVVVSRDGHGFRVDCNLTLATGQALRSHGLGGDAHAAFSQALAKAESRAVMDLDLTDSQAIVFRNAAHGGLSVVYRRADGNIGWVDPERTRRPA